MGGMVIACLAAKHFLFKTPTATHSYSSLMLLDQIYCLAHSLIYISVATFFICIHCYYIELAESESTFKQEAANTPLSYFFILTTPAS
jgi:hypothetical protein